MANKKLTVTTYVVRDNINIKLDNLPTEEKKRLADQWNKTAMEAAGFTMTYPLAQAV